VSEAFETFHAGLIDYAGLFPPAKLDLATAINNYAKYRESEDSWMLGAFIIPVDRLEELSNAHGELFNEPEELYYFTVLMPPSDETQLAAQIDKLEAFQLRHIGGVQPVAVETRIPPELLAEDRKKELHDFFRLYNKAFGKAHLEYLRISFEVPAGEDWYETDLRAIEGLAHVRSLKSCICNLGLKLRCGGLEPSAFPHTMRVARIIKQCDKQSVPLRFTAGLHHPIRHYSVETGAMMHGFLNVFGAVIFCNVYRFSEELLEVLLCETEPSHFAFGPKHFSWRGCSVGWRQISRARMDHILGFGSCSFDEPREDLRALGMLD